jgi:hypothetical protein
MKDPDAPALSLGVIIYVIGVLVVVVGIAVAVGRAIQAPTWLTIGLAGGSGISYVVGMVWWVKTHVPPGNRRSR